MRDSITAYEEAAIYQYLLQQSNFLNQNISFGYLKEPSQRDGSFEQPKHML